MPPAILQTLKTRWGIASAVVFSSLIFTLVHLLNPGSDYPWWMILASLFVCGAVMAQAYLVSGSLWLPIGIHFALDLWPTLLAEQTTAPKEAVLFASSIGGNLLLTGPNGAGEGVFDLIGMGLLALILFLWGRSKKRFERSQSLAYQGGQTTNGPHEQSGSVG